MVVEWSRADLRDEYVFVYRDGRFEPDDQHPSFKNRVDLQDRQMKDGDVSLILKDVTINDTGTYECRVFQEVEGPMTLINSTNLVVDPPGKQGGHTEDGSVELKIGLSVSAVLLVAAIVGLLIYRKHKQKQSQDSYQPPVELQVV
ncbi:programmed cell death 1 ligand 1-like [Oreochromis aureus]|uniref:programmed cell death 1 ligand 1-like n=1 Tax=Oreochromis aureus TaxID=47969 RepID=UPI001954E6F6|nr:programmed cell death 1 ligand 1-like [Oreochromis aureus]